jgi:hypothetical protein
MGNFTSVRLTALALVITAVVTAEEPPTCPDRRLRSSSVVCASRTIETASSEPGVLRFESGCGSKTAPTSWSFPHARKQIDTYAIRRFSSSGKAASLSTDVTVEDSVLVP